MALIDPDQTQSVTPLWLIAGGFLVVSTWVGAAAGWWLPVAAGWAMSALILFWIAAYHRHRREGSRVRRAATVGAAVFVVAVVLSIVAAAEAVDPLQRYLAVGLPLMAAAAGYVWWRRLAPPA